MLLPDEQNVQESDTTMHLGVTKASNKIFDNIVVRLEHVRQLLSAKIAKQKGDYVRKGQKRPLFLIPKKTRSRHLKDR